MKKILLAVMLLLSSGYNIVASGLPKSEPVRITGKKSMPSSFSAQELSLYIMAGSPNSVVDYCPVSPITPKEDDQFCPVSPVYKSGKCPVSPSPIRGLRYANDCGVPSPERNTPETTSSK